MVDIVIWGLRKLSLTSFSQTFLMVLEKRIWLRFFKNGQGQG